MAHRQQAETIRLTEDIDRDSLGEVDYESHSFRTPGKDDAAKIILELVDNGEWPKPLSELAEETEWSRGHFYNTIKAYFETVDSSPQDTSDTVESNPQDLTVTIPDDVEHVETYLRGVAKGIQMSKGE